MTWREEEDRGKEELDEEGRIERKMKEEEEDEYKNKKKKVRWNSSNKRKRRMRLLRVNEGAWR